MDWSCLPYDIADKILISLSLWELAHISRTCSQFDQVFRHRLNTEQKGRCDLAIQRFGKEWVSGITDVANCFLKGQPLDLDSGGFQRAPLKPRDADVSCGLCSADLLVITVYLPNESAVALTLIPQFKVWVELKPSRDDDVEGAALVQALISGEFAEQKWQHVEVHILWGNCKDAFTAAGLQNLVAPLLPLALVYKHEYH